MFARKNRIPRNELEIIIKQTRSIGGDFFNVKFLPNELDFPRFSIIVSKKVAKSSVLRHLLKRKMFSAVRINFNGFPAQDYVFFLKKEAAVVNFKELKNGVTRFIEKNSL